MSAIPCFYHALGLVVQSPIKLILIYENFSIVSSYLALKDDFSRD